MVKIYFNNFIKGVFLMIFSAIIAATLIALISLGNITFNLTVLYSVGCIIGIFCGILSERFFIRKYNYFSQNELTAKNNFWVNRINSKRYIKRITAYLSFIPSFLMFVGMLVLSILIYPLLSELLKSNKWYSVASIIIGTSLSSSLTYSILGLMSFKVCKKCGTVNAFIYDDTLDYETMSDTETKTEIPSGNWRTFVKQNVRSYSGKSNDKDSFIGNAPTFSERTIETFTQKVICHCSYCNDKVALNEKKTFYGKWKKS